MGWRELWESVSFVDHAEFPSGQFMVGLNAFAFWGLRPDLSFCLGSSDADREITQAVEAYVAHARALHDAVPPGWGDLSDLHRTVIE